MRRVVVGTPALLTLTTDVKPSAGTVTITRDRDGVVLVNAQAVTVGASFVKYQLPAQSTLSNLTSVWTLTRADGTQTITEKVQVVSTRAATIAQVRRLRPLDDVNRYPDALIDQAITVVEDELEAATGVSFCGREFQATLDGSGTRDLYVEVGKPRSVTAASVATTAMTGAEADVLSTYALSSDDLAKLVVDDRSGTIYRQTIWPLGRNNIVLTGTCGFTEQIGMVSMAVAKQVRYMLVDSPTHDRAMSVSNEDGTTQNLIVAGVRGNRFAIPEMNVVCETYRSQFGVA